MHQTPSRAGRRMPGIKSRGQLLREHEPQDDYGFFGPDSVTWKVWSHPTGYLVGFVRAVTIEHLDPHLAAAVIQSGGVRARPNGRYAATLKYFGQVAFGATEPNLRAADELLRVHAKAVGHDPVTGTEYDANRPSSQLWIHVTAWHSILLCYERFGPGRLSAEEETRYWTECARAAQLQTIDPATVPRSREEVRRFFAEWRPRLAISEGARDMVHFLLSLRIAVPPGTPRWKRALILAPIIRLARPAIISTYPRYVRDLFGIRQGPVVDALIRPLARAAHAIVARSVPLTFFLGELVAPEAVSVLAPVLLGIPPRRAVTMSPDEARRRLTAQ